MSAEQNKINIKVSTNYYNWPILMQTPGSRGIWNQCVFFVDDEKRQYDWWVIIEGISRTESVLSRPQNTILVTIEPSHIKKYHDRFLKQFNVIVTTQPQITAEKIFHVQLVPWHIGAQFNPKNKKFEKFHTDYDTLKAGNVPTKSKLISVISSQKNNTPGHRERLRFIEKLKKHFGDRLDVFEPNEEPLSDKWDAIAPYQYHIVLENGSTKDYWTEKLADVFLGQAYPIYYGCPNIHDYFSPDSLSCIDTSKPTQAIQIIEDAISKDLYSTSQQQILTAKEKVLNHYQLIPRLADIISTLEKEKKNSDTTIVTIHPEILETASFFEKQIGKYGLILKKYYPNIHATIKKLFNL
jgi:hypothetical protein